MRARLIAIALILATLGAGGTWLSLQPIVSSRVEAHQALTGDAQRATRLEVVVALLGLLDVLAAVVVGYVVLTLTVAQPLQTAERRAAAVLEREGRRLPLGGPPGTALAQAVSELHDALELERATSRRRLNELTLNAEQKARLQSELVAADRLATVGKLAAGVAHEVGNPLSGILGYLSVLRLRAPQNDPSLEVVDRIEAEVKRIDSIVRGLLEMGRPSRGKAQPIDLRPIIDGCVKMVSSMKENAQVRIDVDCPETAWVRAEAGPLAQVLVNLLLNACQSQAGQGSVRISLALEKGESRLFVDDDGPGSPADVLPRLFTPFFTTKAPGQGTGLGLAVSRHLLGQFDGKLTAGNREKGGARFTISLPSL
ncbi:MAG: two-component sensor histidine kinase [Archangium sp.]|nr:two-component sensor histidine kinase [Archangium sp.]